MAIVLPIDQREPKFDCLERYEAVASSYYASIQVGECACANRIDDEPAFAWWVKHVIKKRDRIWLSIPMEQYHTRYNGHWTPNSMSDDPTCCTDSLPQPGKNLQESTYNARGHHRVQTALKALHLFTRTLWLGRNDALHKDKDKAAIKIYSAADSAAIRH